MASLPPSFPKGLRVLLVDDDASRPITESQLRQPELQYTVTVCGSSTEALAYSRAASSSVDVVLAESKLVAADEMSGRAFVDAFEDTPVVLMSEGGDTDDVMRAVTLGAVDFLDKPLSVLKLKNIWQHSVRKMMQRASLYDGPAKSEPAPMQHNQPQSSISNCLPSSMTAPITLAPCPLKKCGSEKLLPHRSSIDSPGTPSADDADPNDAISAGSVRYHTNEISTAGATAMSMGTSDRDTSEIVDVDSASVGHRSNNNTAAQTQRPPLSCKPSSFGALVPVPPVSQWPSLDPGCVWGTPVGGPLPPPLSAAPPSAWQPTTGPLPQVVPPSNTSQLFGQQQSLGGLTPRDSPRPVLLKSRASIDNSSCCTSTTSMPSTAPNAVAATAANAIPMIPAGFFSLNKAKQEGGPIGLKLRKSDSLLDLINETLATPSADATSGLARSV